MPLYLNDQKEFGHGVSLIAQTTNYMSISFDHALQLSPKRNINMNYLILYRIFFI